MKKLYVFLTLIGLFFSCVSNIKKEKAQYFDSIISKTIGKELLLPQKLILYKPHSNYSMDSCDIANASHKIYSHINVSCGSCLKEIEMWEKLIPQFEKLGVSIIIICTADDNFILFEYLCEKNKFINYSFPFFLDMNDKYTRLNKFVNLSNDFKTILTDKENRILLLGNPINSKKIMRLYLDKIKNE